MGTGPAIAFLMPILPYLLGQPLPDYKKTSAKSFFREQFDEQVAGLKPEGVDEFMGQVEEGLEKGGKSDAKPGGGVNKMMSSDLRSTKPVSKDASICSEPWAAARRL